MSKRNKYKSISLRDKYEILEMVKSKVKYSDIMVKHNIKHASNISNIVKNREKIIYEFENGQLDSSRKKMRSAKFPELEKALIQFMEKVHNETDLPLNGILLKEKALIFADKLGLENFNASGGWLDRFRERYGIKFSAIHGESKSVNENVVNDWTTNKLPDIIQNYEPKDVFNGDEFGLFYKCLPNKKMTLKGQSCSGGKQSKERITVFIACNMDGSEKLKMTVIGKYQKPHCFKNFKNKPVNYFSNKTAWMKDCIFKEVLEEINKNMIKQNRKILFFVDNCSAHPENLKFSNVKIMFLPANTTARLQPCDAGIIAWIKKNYRIKLVRKLLVAYENKEDLKIDLKDAILLLHSSWKELKSSTVKNCFKKCGFNTESQNDETEDNDLEENTNWENLASHLELNLSFTDYITMDDNLTVCEKLTADSIAENILREKNNDIDITSGSDTEIDDTFEDNTPNYTFKETLQMITNIKNFVASNTKIDIESFHLLDILEKKIVDSHIFASKQTLISDYFK
jgi:hypothetical protein